MSVKTESKEEKLINLPTKEEMEKRLLELHINDYIQSKLFPLLLKEAGREVYPQAVILIVTLAIHDATKGLPAMIGSLLMDQIPEILSALIIDEEGLKQAMEFYNEVNKKQ